MKSPSKYYKRHFDTFSVLRRKLVVWGLSMTMAIVSTFLTAGISQNDHNLKSVENPHFDSLLMAKDATIPASRKIYVTEVEANFASDWKRLFRSSTTKRYRNQILTTYGQTLHEHIEQTLASSGWKLLEQPETGCFVANIKMKDIYINGPERADMEHVLVSNIGHSHIQIVVQDAESQPIMKINDYREAPGLTDFFVEADRAVNFNGFNKFMKEWAKEFAIYMEMTVNLAEAEG